MLKLQHYLATVHGTSSLCVGVSYAGTLLMLATSVKTLQTKIQSKEKTLLQEMVHYSLLDRSRAWSLRSAR